MAEPQNSSRRHMYRHRGQWLEFVQRLNPDSDPVAIRLMDELRFASHTLYQIGESSLEEAGLSFAKYRILMGLLFSEEIEDRPELNPSEISERQGTSRNTISALIGDLEEQELIERTLDRHDRRKFNIRLTEAGRATVRAHASRHFQTIADCFAGLSQSEQETLNQLLSRLTQAVSVKQHQLEGDQ